MSTEHGFRVAGWTVILQIAERKLEDARRGGSPDLSYQQERVDQAIADLVAEMAGPNEVRTLQARLGEADKWSAILSNQVAELTTQKHRLLAEVDRLKGLTEKGKK